MKNDLPVLAMYGFRSKQEFIYRTNRMREITGASELIANMFDQFLNHTEIGKRIRDDWDEQDKVKRTRLLDEDGYPTLDEVLDATELGAVVYEGGGNLLVLYRRHSAYIEANKAFSRFVIEQSHTISMIVGASTWDSILGFDGNLKEVLKQYDKNKRLGDQDMPCNVLPFTHVDPVTYQPIVEIEYKGSDRIELSREAKHKLAAWRARAQCERENDRANDLLLENGMSTWEREGRFLDDLVTEKGTDSLIAIMYLDGNSIRNKVERATTGAADKIAAMRDFSISLHQELVDIPETKMTEAVGLLPDEYQGYRVIVDHGDEITFICNAHAAPLALDAYFDAVENSEHGHHACAGVVFCHSHDPFALAYSIAEECCESGKKRNREEQLSDKDDASFVDMHFIRSGITGSLEKIRDEQPDGSLCPYSMEELALFLRVGRRLKKKDCLIRRSDIKALNRAILRGEPWYRIELERLRAKDPKAIRDIEDMLAKEVASVDLWQGRYQLDELMRLLLSDVTCFWDIFDLCFSSVGEGGKK